MNEQRNSVADKTVAELLTDDRFLVAAEALRRGYGSLWDLIERAFGKPRQTITDTMALVEFHSIVFATTEALQNGTVKISDHARAKYKEFYVHPIDEVIADPKGKAAPLLASERFLVAVDAYRLGFGAMSHLMWRAFEVPPFIPNGFDYKEFVHLIFAIAKRIEMGTIEISDVVKTRYRDFYTQPPPMPDEEF